jgi:hypothetical protein
MLTNEVFFFLLVIFVPSTMSILLLASLPHLFSPLFSAFLCICAGAYVPVSLVHLGRANICPNKGIYGLSIGIHHHSDSDNAVRFDPLSSVLSVYAQPLSASVFSERLFMVLFCVLVFLHLCHIPRVFAFDIKE